jgi:hypothetical protein
MDVDHALGNITTLDIDIVLIVLLYSKYLDLLH